MKKFRSIAVLSCLVMGLWLSTASAQEDPVPQPGSGFPDISSARQVATIFHRLVGVRPNFKQWVRFIDDCKNLDDLARIECEETKPAEMDKEYALTTAEQPIVVQFLADMSQYSYENGGYVVKNFEDGVFFPYTFAGANYAVIPQGLMDYQFLSIIDEPARKVERTLSYSKRRKMLMVIYVLPTYANKDEKAMEMTGPDGTVKPYKLISGRVANVALYECPKNGSCVSLWDQGTKEFRDQQKQELLDLKQ